MGEDVIVEGPKTTRVFERCRAILGFCSTSGGGGRLGRPGLPPSRYRGSCKGGSRSRRGEPACASRSPTSRVCRWLKILPQSTTETLLKKAAVHVRGGLYGSIGRTLEVLTLRYARYRFA
jgi:hypothetical protein